MKKFLNNRAAVIWTSLTLIVLIWFLCNALTGQKIDSDSNKYYNEKSTIGLISPFQNKEEESQYQKWYVEQRQKAIPDSTLQRKQFDHFYNTK